MWVNADEVIVDEVSGAPSTFSSRDHAHDLGLPLQLSKEQPMVQMTSLWLLPDSNPLLRREGYLTALGDLGQTEKSF